MLKYFRDRCNAILTVLLWDIDGTLIRSNKSKVNLHQLVLEQYFKREIYYYCNTEGMTDCQVILSIAKYNNIFLNSALQKVLLQKLDLLTQKLMIDKALTKFYYMPNVITTLQQTRILGLVNGVATGNTKLRAQIKLNRSNLLHLFDKKHIYFGGKAKSRFNFLESIKKNYETQIVVVIGDSILDVLSAKHCGFKVVAAATGKTKFADLKKVNPDLLIKDFKIDNKKFLSFISDI